MIIGIVGEADTRPLLYTLMKLCQGLGDVLVVSNSSRIQILSDTKETGGNYQNCMIAYTEDGLDIFLRDFGYTLKDFTFTLLDNIIAGETDIVFHVNGLAVNEDELDLINYLENVVEFDQYTPKYTRNVFYNLEKFESFGMMNQINPAISEFVAKTLSPHLKLNENNLKGILATGNPMPDKTKKRTKTIFDRLKKLR